MPGFSFCMLLLGMRSLEFRVQLFEFSILGVSFLDCFKRSGFRYLEFWICILHFNFRGLICGFYVLILFF